MAGTRAGRVVGLLVSAVGVGQSPAVTTGAWGKIAVGLVLLFVVSIGAGYGVGAQVNDGIAGDAAAASRPSGEGSATAAPETSTSTSAYASASTPASNQASNQASIPVPTPPPTSAPTTAPQTTTVPPETTTTTEPGPRRPDREHPLRVVLAGDSVMAGLAPAVKAALEADGTTTVRFILTPSILRDPTVRFTWNQQLTQFDPEVIVMFVGTWESGVVQGVTKESVDAPGWQQHYQQTVLDPWIQLITSRGASVIWLGNPVVHNDDANHAFAALNAAFATLPARFPSVTFVETNPTLNGTQSGYHDIIPAGDGTLVRTRQTDGLHLCAAGAALLGQLVATDIADRFKATVAPSWQDGAWIHDSVYPPASCPVP